MKRIQSFSIAIGGLAVAVLARADPLADTVSKVKVQPFIPLKVHAFALQDVRLLDGPFKHAMEMDAKYLLSLDVDRLLHNFRVNAGLPSSAQPLGGWEGPDQDLRGHFVGNYLSACAEMYASTGDKRVKDRGDAVVAGMAECQAKLGRGYLSAFPESFIDRVEQRVQVWCPYYTLHKIFAGLLDMYEYCDNPQALAVAQQLADWVIARNAKLSDEQMQAMLETEHGGMNEALANFYALTGEDKYLKMAFRFNHDYVLGPASQHEDRLTGLHANTQFPKFIGAAREYELTGDYSLKTAASFFWDTVVKNRSYVIGGNSDGEAFTDPSRLSQMGGNTTETCNTYNMLKLTRHLLCWDPQVEYADYYERGLYNHILASQNPDDGMMCYYVKLRSGSRKTYSTTLHTFTCCTATGLENHAKYGDSIYFHNDSNLYVSLFIASELNWPSKGIKLRQETKFPDEGTSRLVFTCRQPTALALQIRHPAWAVDGIQLRVNGEDQALDTKPGSWATLDRAWKSGDTVEIRLPFSLHAEAFRDNPNRFAFLNGPLVLAAEVDTRKPLPVVFADEATVVTSLQPVARKPNTFTAARDVFRTTGAEGGATLEPFYKIHGLRRYEVYWDRITPEQLQARETEYRAELARQKKIAARTVDYVSPGEEQNERDHNLRGADLDTLDFNDRVARIAGLDSWFSWDLKVLPNQTQELSIAFGQATRRAHGASPLALHIFVDDVKIDTEAMTTRDPDSGAVPDPKVYVLDAKRVQGKRRITVKFQTVEGTLGGCVASVRVMRPTVEK